VKNLTLTEVELKRLNIAFAVVLAGLALLIWAIAVYGFGVGPLDAGTRALSLALGMTSLVFLAFYRWGWRQKRIARWMRRPRLQGVWLGYLESDFGRAPNEGALRLRIVFIIRQTYLTLSIQSFTERQSAESNLESLLRNTTTDATRLAYVFELQKGYAGSSKHTRGAGMLTLRNKDKILDGEYWTSSPTNGSVRLQQVSRDYDKVHSFAEAVHMWPEERSWKVDE
jgi:hypothetical protein